MIKPEDVLTAYHRIKDFIIKTPILESSLLNKALGHRIIFKAESLQKTGAYKVRGALNSVISLKQKNKLPKDFVAYSSGNHAQALAYAANLHNSNSTIFMPKYTSIIKQKSAQHYGAKIILTDSRLSAEEMVLEYQKKGYYNLPPSSDDMIIAGNGTICYEMLEQLGELPDAIFAACGGGGLLSGTHIASKIFSDKILIYGGEPLNANDATQSLRNGKIFKLKNSPDTIADGARTLAITEKIFEYLKQIEQIFEITEEEILYWNSWIMHLLKIVCEPTAALSMAAAAKWLSDQNTSKVVVIILSGGNLDSKTYNSIWSNNYLEYFPSTHIFK